MYPQTGHYRDRCTGPTIEAQEKADKMSRRGNVDQPLQGG